MEGNSNFDYLLDVNSSNIQEGVNDSLKDIIREDYLFFSKYLNDLYFIEANIVYMNYVARVPQTKIADIFNMKQYGVSKRISSALRRLSIQLKAPEVDIKDSYDFLKRFIPPHKAYLIVVWYSLKTISSVSKSVRVSSSIVATNIEEVKEVLEGLSESRDFESFIKELSKSVELEEVDEFFLKTIEEDYSHFLVTKHKIRSHLKHIKDLQDYNSRGSHNFRKDWH